MKRWMVIVGVYALAFCALFLQHYRLAHVEEEEIFEKQVTVISTGALLQDHARFRAAGQMFSKLHPDVGISIAKVNKELSVLLASGDHGADLVYSLNEQPEFFEDLRTYERIMTEMDAHWIDIGAMVDDSGRIFCLPDTFSLQTFSAMLFVRDAGALSEAGIVLPEDGFSYEQFRVLAQQASAGGRALLAMDEGAKHILDTHRALWPDVGYDSPEFRAALAFWKEMSDAGYVVFTKNVNAGDALMTCSCAHTVDPDGNLIDLQPAAVLSGLTVPLPTAQGSPRVFLPVWAWSILKDGAQKELAAELLACLASLDAQEELEDGGGGMVLSDIKAYDRWRRWTWQQVSGFYAYPGLEADGYTRWVGMLEQSAFAPMHHSVRDQFAQLFPLYLRGDISADELIAQMD